MAEQRKQLFIKRRFQQNMILEVLLITFILINLIVIAGYLVIDSMSDIQQLKQTLAFMVAGFEIIGFAVVYRFNVKSSHRIAGPVFVIERSLKFIESGDLAFTMRLRQGDQFLEVCDQVNSTVGALRERVARVQQLAHQLRDGDGSDRTVADQLVQELDFFKTQQTSSSAAGDASEGQGETQ
jgi:sensor histidine kinase YesM